AVVRRPRPALCPDRRQSEPAPGRARRRRLGADHQGLLRPPAADHVQADRRRAEAVPRVPGATRTGVARRRGGRSGSEGETTPGSGRGVTAKKAGGEPAFILVDLLCDNKYSSTPTETTMRRTHTAAVKGRHMVPRLLREAPRLDESFHP